MNDLEIKFINSNISNVNIMNTFGQIQDNIPNRSEILNQNPNKNQNFIEELDFRTNKIEKMKDDLKGDAFYLENKKSKFIKKESQRAKRVTLKTNKMSITERRKEGSIKKVIHEKYINNLKLTEQLKKIKESKQLLNMNEDKIENIESIERNSASMVNRINIKPETREAFSQNPNVIKKGNVKSEDTKYTFFQNPNTTNKGNAKSERTSEAFSSQNPNISSRQFSIDQQTKNSNQLENSPCFIANDSNLFITTPAFVTLDANYSRKKAYTIDLNHKQKDSRNKIASSNKEETNSTTQRTKKQFSSINSDILFSEENRNRVNKIDEQPEKLEKSEISKIHSLSPSLKFKNPQVHKIFYDLKSDKKSRRKVISLVDKEDINLFVEAIRNKTEKKMNYRYSLIPKPKIDTFIKHGSRLHTIYNNCIREEKVSEQIDKIIHKEKHKVITNSLREYERKVRRMQMEQDFFVLDDEEGKLTQQKKGGDMVFIYNEGKFVANNKGKKNQTDFISKISEKLAYLERHFLISEFGSTFHKDPEFIFVEELKENKKNMEKAKLLSEKHFREEKKKHEKVEQFLNKTIKGKELLLNKVTNNIIRVNELREGNYEIDENYFIDFWNLEKKNIRKDIPGIIHNCSSPDILKANPNPGSLHKNKSMKSINGLLPKIK